MIVGFVLLRLDYGAQWLPGFFEAGADVLLAGKLYWPGGWRRVNFMPHCSLAVQW